MARLYAKSFEFSDDDGTTWTEVEEVTQCQPPQDANTFEDYKTYDGPRKVMVQGDGFEIEGAYLPDSNATGQAALVTKHTSGDTSLQFKITYGPSENTAVAATKEIVFDGELAYAGLSAAEAGRPVEGRFVVGGSSFTDSAIV